MPVESGAGYPVHARAGEDKGEGVGAVAVKAMGWAHSFPMSKGVRAGRQWTRRRLESLPWAAAEPDTVDSIVLAVSELITNAHIHAHSDAYLVLTWDGDCLHVSVHDEDPTLPRHREPQPGEVSGRGVAIVRKLADEWGIRCQRRGKTVTACFRPAEAEPDTTADPDVGVLGHRRDGGGS